LLGLPAGTSYRLLLPDQWVRLPGVVGSATATVNRMVVLSSRHCWL
jgi:hypothetical protein